MKDPYDYCMSLLPCSGSFPAHWASLGPVPSRALHICSPSQSRYLVITSLLLSYCYSLVLTLLLFLSYNPILPLYYLPLSYVLRRLLPPDDYYPPITALPPSPYYYRYTYPPTTALRRLLPSRPPSLRLLLPTTIRPTTTTLYDDPRTSSLSYPVIRCVIPALYNKT